MKRILFLLLLTVSVYGQNPSRFAKIQITGNSNSGTATKVNVQEANGEVNTQTINTGFNKNIGLGGSDVVGAATLLNQYSTTPVDWTATTFDSGNVVFYGGKQWIAKIATVAGDVPSVSSKWEEITFEALANKTVIVDAIPTGGSTNAVSSNGVFDALATKAPISSVHNPVTIGTANGLSLATQQLSLGLASSGVTGALSSTDWNTFNNKQDALGYTPENVANKQNSLAVDGTGIKYPTVDAVNTGLALKAIRNSIDFRGKDIEFFGDSYTSGSGATSTDKRWTSIVSRVLGATEINRGVAGTTLMKRTPINYMASPNMVDNVVNIPTKTASKAMLVIAYGLNDMGQLATAYTTDNFKTDYQFVLNNAMSKGWLPSQILLIPAYYIGSSGYAAYATITGNAAPTEARHLSFIQATKEIADLNGTMYFDVYQDQKKNNTTLLNPDNIHPNDAGHLFIANDVLQYLGADKIGVTTNTTYDLKAGFIPNNNGSVFYNSLIYDSGARIGIGTISPQSTFHVNSLVNTVDQRFTNSVTGSTNLDGTSLSVDLNADFVVNNYENKGVITATNNTIRNYTNNIGQTIFGGTTASNTTNKIQVIGSAQAMQWIADNGTNGSFFQGKNAGSNLFVIGNDNAIGGGSINDLAYYSYTGNHKFYQPVFAPTAPAGTNTTQVATTAFVQAAARPYKVYTALLSQTGTNAPIATVLENTLGGTIVWSRTGVGIYNATLSGAFTTNKTIIFISQPVYNWYETINWLNTSILNSNTRKAGVLSDDVFSNTSVEIRVYL